MICGRKLTLAACLVAALMFVLAGDSRAEEIFRLRSGISVQGSGAPLPSLNKNSFAAAGGGIKSQPILLINDGLRRIYMHRRGMLDGEPKPARAPAVTIKFNFKKAIGGRVINGIGALQGVSPFNKYGRRSVLVRGPTGNLSILQGIAEINKRYAILQALKDKPAYDWDMRVATVKLDSDTLRRVFNQRLAAPGLSDNQRLDMRLEHVRFFIDAERYADAAEELKSTIRAFPNQPGMEKRLSGIIRLQFDQLIREANSRADVGQEDVARSIFNNFPLQLVDRATQIDVQDAIQKLDDRDRSHKAVVAKLRGQVRKLAPDKIKSIEPILAEMEIGMSRATYARMSDYQRFADDPDTPLDSQVALGISGWLLGQGEGEQNLSVAISAFEVRNLVREYLGSADAGRRESILQQLGNLEGAEPEYIARMLPLMAPPLQLPDENRVPDIAGMYVMGGEQTADDNVPRYTIQLPPNYDPLREYKCIVAMHPPGSTPSTEIDWWAGFHNPRFDSRVGHATRHGYVVIAPAWTRDGQSIYEYTPREHQRVLVALRDAMRRVSIDSDRVFLAGHGQGGTAAWDIAVSHPDIWAGMIAISPDAGKTITHYFPNAQNVPIYIVHGELDGVISKDNHALTSIMEDYANVRADAMWVQYRGWGYSLFFEEIHHLFEWTNSVAHRRKDIPQEIDCVTMRDGDEFFWWLEMDGLKQGVAIDPVLWDQAKRIRGKLVKGMIGANNAIRISQGPSERFTVWLRPDMGVDLNEKVSVRYGSRSFSLEYNGEIKTMLEDARQRADRKRPFWTKISVPN